MQSVHEFGWVSSCVPTDKVMCLNHDCYASINGLPSVVKVGWLIRCECCGTTHGLNYYERSLKALGGSSRGK